MYTDGNRRAREELRSGQKRSDTERGQCYTAVVQGRSVHTVQSTVAGLIEKNQHDETNYTSFPYLDSFFALFPDLLL